MNKRKKSPRSRKLKDNKKRLEEIFENHWYWLKGSDKHKRAIFKNLDFSGIKLNGKDLSHVVFDNMDLSGADLSNCEFQKTIFKNCNLEGANFSNSNLWNSSVEDNKVLDADFTNSRLDYLSKIYVKENGGKL